MEALARAAVWRARSLYQIVLAAIVVISGSITMTHLSLEHAPALLFWLVGCAAILILGAFWVRSRERQARRLQELYQSEEEFVSRVEVLNIWLVFIPFGVEIGLRLEPNEYLSLGFWSRRKGERLVELLELRLTPRARAKKTV